MKIFQTSSLFETNKFHHGGALSAGSRGNCPCCPPLNPALVLPQKATSYTLAHMNITPSLPHTHTSLLLS